MKATATFAAERSGWVIRPSRLDDDELAARALRLITILEELERQRKAADAFHRFHNDRWRWVGDTLIVVTAIGTVVATLPAATTVGAVVSAAGAVGECVLHFWKKSQAGRHHEAAYPLLDMLNEVRAELDAVNGEIQRRRLATPPPPEPPTLAP